MTSDLQIKYQLLLENLRQYDSIAVAFSGGVDSSFLLFAAQEALPGKVIALTAYTQSYPEHESKDAEVILGLLKIEQIRLEIDQLEIESFANNTIDRCYYCKRTLFSEFIKVAKSRGFGIVADGANKDDEQDYRPGMRATVELKIKSPLRDIGLTKAEIRSLSKKFNLPTSDKPSFACLASRIPYGEKITAEKLCSIEKAEQFLLDLGLQQMRVRCHDKVARIEIPEADFDKIMTSTNRKKIVAYFKEVGFDYISLDLEGFYSGSLNRGFNHN